MAVAIRLSCGGAKKRPYYKIVVTDARNATWVISAAVPTTSRLTTSQSLPSTSPPAGVTAAQKGVGEMPGAIWRTLRRLLSYRVI